MTDKELYERILAGDEDAFNQFIHQYVNLFYNMAQKIIGYWASDDIHDCLSESYIYIWYHIDQYDPNKYSFRNWCSLIICNRAQNKLLKSIRHKKKLDKLREQKKSQLNYIISAEDEYLVKEKREILSSKINELASPGKEIFIYRYVEGLKPKEIAEILSLTPKQIDNYLNRAKQHLRMEEQIDEIK